MNIEHLRAFIEVAASGSFHKAAERLHITQSSVSARIKALEQRLNRPLFNRNRHGVTLTSGGNLLYRHAVSVISTWERAQHDVALPTDVRTTVSLGLPMNHWGNITADWIAWMEQHQPRVATQVQSDYSVLLMNELREGLLDVAILYEPHHWPDVVLEPFLEEPLQLVSTQADTQFAGHGEGYVYISWGRSFSEQHNKAFPGARRHRLSITQETIALEYILKHGGSAYFSQFMVKDLLADERLHAVAGAPQLSVRTYLAFSTLRERSIETMKAVEGLKAIPFYTQGKTFN
ncbi:MULTISPECIES: LysR family transcriptional regulator [Pseudomonas]|uniref:LysR family transcriptional regulator n=1 Tax=Pseudomonas TaxID=286 RepID=UPI002DB72506|nr:LysR family transcriptional regulator [Pseudomonas asiatica]MEB6590919.1 LysR family transcriptional regulator [Pseudomonas asiatica]